MRPRQVTRVHPSCHAINAVDLKLVKAVGDSGDASSLNTPSVAAPLTMVASGRVFLWSGSSNATSGQTFISLAVSWPEVPLGPWK